MGFDTIVVGDCMDVMAGVGDGGIDLIVSDWDYYTAPSFGWHRPYDSLEEYLDWIGRVCSEYRRILAANGSLYAFASKRAAWAVEGRIREHFDVVSVITWAKPNTRIALASVDALRVFFPISEVVFLCEHRKAAAVEGSETLREYLRGEWLRAGLRVGEANVATDTSGMAGHYFGASQWALPTEEHYDNLRVYIGQRGRRPAPPYEEWHVAPRSWFERRGSEREYLRADYHDLSRPFNAEARCGDVWDFPIVTGQGGHPCEKPLAMMERIVRTSSRRGDMVGDFFCGHGTALVAAAMMGRRWIGCDTDPGYVKVARLRVDQAQLRLL